MAIPEEHKERVLKYFEAVGQIEEQKKQEMRDNGSSEADIELNNLNITMFANQAASVLLGYSYYPWPFGATGNEINADGNLNV